MTEYFHLGTAVFQRHQRLKNTGSDNLGFIRHKPKEPIPSTCLAGGRGNVSILIHIV